MSQSAEDLVELLETDLKILVEGGQPRTMLGAAVQERFKQMELAHQECVSTLKNEIERLKNLMACGEYAEHDSEHARNVWLHSKKKSS